MANSGQLWQLRQGAREWNSWRMRNGAIYPDLLQADLRNVDLKGADLSFTNLSYADLRSANLNGARLFQASLFRANLTGSDLRGADLGESNLNEAVLDGVHHTQRSINKTLLEEASLKGANLRGTTFIESSLAKADFTGADLTGARFDRATLDGANFTRAKLNGANFTGTSMLGTILHDADLSASLIYGTSVWDLNTNQGTKQENLIITRAGEPEITVDNIKIAQFIYLLLSNQEIRGVIDTITSKAVLILGRFTKERKAILDVMREELRNRGYVPIMFDFDPAESRDTVETIRILAGMARFVLADLTDARSVLQELQAIVPDLPSVPVRFIIKRSEKEPGMLDHIRKFPWVVPEAFEYDDTEEVIASIGDKTIEPARAKLRPSGGPQNSG
jgi:uncharacterized protein YjbI with pentapeptide repeats